MTCEVGWSFACHSSWVVCICNMYREGCFTIQAQTATQYQPAAVRPWADVVGPWGVLRGPCELTLAGIYRSAARQTVQGLTKWLCTLMMVASQTLAGSIFATPNNLKTYVLYGDMNNDGLASADKEVSLPFLCHAACWWSKELNLCLLSAMQHCQKTWLAHMDAVLPSSIALPLSLSLLRRRLMIWWMDWHWQQYIINSRYIATCMLVFDWILLRVWWAIVALLSGPPLPYGRVHPLIL